MTIEITGCAAGHDDDANAGVARPFLQRLGEHVTHLRIEVDALCAPQGDNRNCVGYSGREGGNIRPLPPPPLGRRSRDLNSREPGTVKDHFLLWPNLNRDAGRTSLSGLGIT